MASDTLYEIVQDLGRSTVSKPRLAYHKQFLNDKFRINQIILSGLQYSLFTEISRSVPFTKEEWSHYLDISIRTLDRYKSEKKRFKTTQSEKIISLLEVLLRGREVFEDFDTFKKWLQIPCHALRNHTPKSLLATSYGKDLVMAELSRIEYGVYS